MKIYLAHNFAARSMLLLQVVPKLQALGHEVTSSWLDLPDQEWTGMERIDQAQTDLFDIRRGDVIIFFADQFGDVPGRGKYVELGYAIGQDKTVYVVGLPDAARSCIFCESHVAFAHNRRYFETIEELLDYWTTRKTQ